MASRWVRVKDMEELCRLAHAGLLRYRYEDDGTLADPLGSPECEIEYAKDHPSLRYMFGYLVDEDDDDG